LPPGGLIARKAAALTTSGLAARLVAPAQAPPARVPSFGLQEYESGRAKPNKFLCCTRARRLARLFCVAGCLLAPGAKGRAIGQLWPDRSEANFNINQAAAR